MDKGMPELDMPRVRRAFDAAAKAYDEHAVLQLEVAQRLLSRLEWLNIKPDTILDLGAGTGQPTASLLKYYPAAHVIALDLSTAMLQKTRKRGRWLRRPGVVCGNSQALPLADNCVDMVFSSLSLQWCDQPEQAFGEIRRVLRPDGVLLFSSFGPDTLKELRSSWAAVDGAHHVHAFMDMHDVGDIIVQAGLQEPVLEREVLTLTYDNARAVMKDLKYIGASNALASRSRGLVGRQRFQQLEQAYEKWRVDGRLPASYEVVYGTAWSGQSSREGMATIAIEDIGKRRGLR
jgi:malonyl-CoA O-methyltransferase